MARAADRGVRRVSTRLRAVQKGRLAALGSAASFAAIPPLARIAYDAGATPGTIVLARLGFGAAAAVAVVSLLNRPWRIPRGEWTGTLAVAVAWMLVTVGYMASFYYIPVSLAVLIFFTFPVQIAVVAPLVERRPPDRITLGGALIAFTGLLLALGPDLGVLDWRGCALAFTAAIGAMATFILSQRLVVEQDMFSFSFHLHLACLAIIGVALPGVGVPSVPANAWGWAAVIAVGVFYVMATLLQFGAIRLAGPARASMVCNAEPVITMIAAAVILGERLGPWQVTGAALVIGAVVLSARADQPES